MSIHVHLWCFKRLTLPGQLEIMRKLVVIPMLQRSSTSLVLELELEYGLYLEFLSLHRYFKPLLLVDSLSLLLHHNVQNYYADTVVNVIDTIIIVSKIMLHTFKNYHCIQLLPDNNIILWN